MRSFRFRLGGALTAFWAAYQSAAVVSLVSSPGAGRQPGRWPWLPSPANKEKDWLTPSPAPVDYARSSQGPGRWLPPLGALASGFVRSSSPPRWGQRNCERVSAGRSPAASTMPAQFARAFPHRLVPRPAPIGAAPGAVTPSTRPWTSHLILPSKQQRGDEERPITAGTTSTTRRPTAFLQSQPPYRMVTTTTRPPSRSFPSQSPLERSSSEALRPIHTTRIVHAEVDQTGSKQTRSIAVGTDDGPLAEPSRNDNCVCAVDDHGQAGLARTAAKIEDTRHGDSKVNGLDFFQEHVHATADEQPRGICSHEKGSSVGGQVEKKSWSCFVNKISTILNAQTALPSAI